jgi:hypothetical protein
VIYTGSTRASVGSTRRVTRRVRNPIDTPLHLVLGDCPVTLSAEALPYRPMQPSPDQSPDRNVTVVEAAAILGITPDAVRSRLRRGSLRRDEAPDGTTLVVLEDDDRDRPDASTSDRETAQTTAAYIGALKSQIEMLERTIAPPYTSRKK